MDIRPAVHEGENILEMAPQVSAENLLVVYLSQVAIGKNISLPVLQKGHGLVIEPLQLKATGLSKDSGQLLINIGAFEQDPFIGYGRVEVTARPVKRICRLPPS